MVNFMRVCLGVLLFVSHHKLNNLLIIVDRNNLITLGNTEKVNKLENLKEI